ncbi:MULTISPECIES: DUF4139 domain-containing protein [unclassified Novosphingobium]|uniref:DUF4139 domain-containing protein n=1 Tax=unclassified Novosphingobium TaxID=2644732 RepID=UPI000F5E5D07|nr:MULTISPECIES: hypothetical protein [unclassified Novosphingobium]MBF5092904.1 hypothetical protein [Novosphingobium sp. NBM11]RQW44783.1 hypothetical protein EH199_07200 [Novosphingobium sp. LASN5T]
MRHLLTTALLAVAAGQAQAAPPVVISARPDAVAVTIYRDPERGDNAIDRDAPGAFALIAETRTVELPPGVATVRFEGVAGGIVPQSAILFGTNPRERNRDAALLSQKGLVDAFTGQQVLVRRTDPATGKVTEERATILSSADRLVIQTPRGAEAVYCSGLAQTLIYPNAPAALSAKPVLTMTTKEQPGGKATITLAYIATGFDWDATYVGTLAPDGKSLGLFAWLTMASADETSFVDANASAVAGRINRSQDTRDDTGRQAREDAGNLDRQSECWPAGTTSDLSVPSPVVMAPPAPMAMAMLGDDIDNIIVTAQRRQERLANVPIAVTAVAENLGDLKLYRVPLPVTVAARSQKQVAFLNKPEIKGDLIYRSIVPDDDPELPQTVYRFVNRKADGLGEPFPAGKVILYQDSPWGRQLIGQTTLADKTTNEEVELVLGEASGVTVETTDTRLKKGTRYNLVMRNANPFPVRFELDFRNPPRILARPSAGRVIRKPGKMIWQTTLPPNSEQNTAYETADR